MVNLLLNAVSVNTTGDAVQFTAGDKRFYITAIEWDGASVAIQEKCPSTGIWIAITNGTFTSNSVKPFLLSVNNAQIRAVLSDAGASTDSVTVAVLS